jgi:hypothetical protein
MLIRRFLATANAVKVSGKQPRETANFNGSKAQ